MIDFLLETSLFTGIVIFLAGTIILGIITFFSLHFLYVKSALTKEHERVGRVLFRTSASLLALLLSFTFASQRVNYFTIKQSLEAEASKLVDIHMDLELYDISVTEPMQQKIRDYVKLLIDEGWEPMTENPFRTRTYLQFYEIYNDIHKLEPAGDSQLELKKGLIADIDEVSDYMQVRIYQTRLEIPYLFYISIFGFIIVMIFFSVYKPDRITITFISIFNAFIGLVMYFIILMNNPLIGPLQIKPEPFQILQEVIEARE